GMLPAGTMLAYGGAVESGAPLAVWKSAPASPSTTLAARRIDLELALKEDLPSVAQIEREIAACSDHVLAERLRRKRGVRRAVGDGTTSVMPIWLWRIGDAVLLAHPNEAFARLQGELRAQVPGRAIAALNLSNGGSVGYLPPRAVYGRDLYQVWQSPFAAGCHEAMVAACARAIGELVPAATSASA
nr:alkaline ceramidase [Planctomycetota bacterium]